MLSASPRTLVAIAAALACLALALVLARAYRRRGQTSPKFESVHLIIDDAAVAREQISFSLIEPLWARVDIYGSWSRYEQTLQPFTISQRHLFAIEWYRSEVNNGGHDQFFSNSTGIVCEHAVLGLDAVGAREAAEILREASRRIGGAPRERELRNQRLDASQADFADLDERFNDLESAGDYNSKALAFARQHAADFLFEGEVERLVLPGVAGEQPGGWP